MSNLTTEELLEEISLIIYGLKLVRRKIDSELESLKSDPVKGFPGQSQFYVDRIIEVDACIRRQENRRKSLTQ